MDGNFATGGKDTSHGEYTRVREEGLGLTLRDMSISRQKQAHNEVRRQEEESRREEENLKTGQLRKSREESMSRKRGSTC